MTALDANWRDRAEKAEADLIGVEMSAKYWADTCNEMKAERDALAKRCASLENKLSNVHANHANCDSELETARDLLDRSVEETRAAKTDRDRLRAKLEVAVEALCSIGNSFAWGENTGIKRSIRGLQEEARAALAKIAAKEGE